MWYVTNQKHGVQSNGFISCAGPWFEVEVDETYVGGREVGVTGRKTNKKSIAADPGSGHRSYPHGIGRHPPRVSFLSRDVPIL